MASPLLFVLLQSTRSYRHGLSRAVFSRVAAGAGGQRWNSTNGATVDEEKEYQRFKDEEAAYENDIRAKILDASLNFVIPHGWSKESLAMGAETLGYPGLTHGLFPKGGVELVYHFEEKSISRLTMLLQEERERARTDPSQRKKTHQLLRNAIEMRLRMNGEYVLAGRWNEALALKIFPTNVPRSLQLLTALTDEMWHYAGDKSADFSWYTKRAALAAVYKSAELAMIQDSSPDFHDTWEFLDRRMEGMTRLQQCSKACSESSVVFRGLFQTALNMTGFGRR